MEHVLLRLCRSRPRELLALRIARCNLTFAVQRTEQPTSTLSVPTASAATGLALITWCTNACTVLTDDAIKPLAALAAACNKATECSSSSADWLVGSAVGQAVGLAELAGLTAAEAWAAGVIAGAALLALAQAGLQEVV
jgi:hypothetical protein